MLSEYFDPLINDILRQCEDIGVIFDYIVIKNTSNPISMEEHRQAALFGMNTIDERLKSFALSRTTEDIPFERFYRVKINNKNIHGEKISFSEFWGNDDAIPKSKHGGKVCFIPDIDGYKTAFFNPPHGLRGTISDELRVFEELNNLLFSPINDNNLDIYKWSDDWSNYFDAGKEWWGTFYWTVYNKEKSLITIIGGSATD